jgi:hypothetical protein
MRTPNNNEKALISFITNGGGVNVSKGIKKYSPTVYQWRGLYLEVLSFDQMIRSGVPASWYAKYLTDYGDWRIREMGPDSYKVRKIKEKEKHESNP